MRNRILAGLGAATLATVGLAAPANAVTDDTADVYIVHAFPGATVDITIASGAITLDDVGPGVAAGPGLASPNVGVDALGGLAPGDYNVVITNTADDSELFNDDLTLAAGTSYTVVAHPTEPAGDFTVSVFENQLTTSEAGNGLITVRHTANVGAVNIFSDGTELAGPLANPDEAVLDVAAATYPAVTAGPEGATDAIDLGDVVLPAGTNILVHAFGPDSDAFSAVVFTIGGLTTPDGVPAGSAGLVDEGAGAGFGWAAGGAALLLMVLVAAGILVRRQTVSAQR
ncbi:DUF4397 domain-containing protein [Chryseoglobus sp. 28M-23]|uniref:DUF4397 domain-containing protein n=1 Tax=Chryseoglobus sp. 28M-23 TaxID=2772253 RepID=UPI001746D186|nr:DUF4397 domain-containing protein [Chryseoglobus sp. 28M-23]QOD92898.1 DUF4397 domain-containing protein [Chryseoglobus sp. 28M-23]